MKWRRRRLPKVDSQQESIATECEAFLSGRYSDYLATQSRPIPDWAWLNRLAHGRLEDVRLLAAPAHGRDPMALVAVLAQDVVRRIDAGETTLDSLQRQTLIPLELAIAARHTGNPPSTARQLHDAIRSVRAHRLPPIASDRPSGQP